MPRPTPFTAPGAAPQGPTYRSLLKIFFCLITIVWIGHYYKSLGRVNDLMNKRDKPLQQAPPSVVVAPPPPAPAMAAVQAESKPLQVPYKPLQVWFLDGLCSHPLDVLSVCTLRCVCVCVCVCVLVEVGPDGINCTLSRRTFRPGVHSARRVSWPNVRSNPSPPLVEPPFPPPPPRTLNISPPQSKEYQY